VSEPPRGRARTPDAAFQFTEPGRALLQARLARFARIVALISLCFYPLGVISRGTVGAIGKPGLESAFGPASTWHLTSIVVFGATWLFARSGVRSLRSLRLVDAGSTILGSAALEMMGLGVAPWTRADIFTIFIVAQLLALRAALVPSTARESVWIAFFALLPTPVLTYVSFTNHPLGIGPPALGLAFDAVINMTFVVAVTGLVSRTVHGLRARVREAMKLGQYTLGNKIGEGGMGVVYEASHALLRRPTAVKLLPPEKAGEHNLVRFEREVQLTSMLTHPNTVAIYDFGRTPEGTFYYAMEYLEGLDLQTLVTEDGPQEAGRVIGLLAQICGALSEAHGVGLIHRDVKPANVILCERGGTFDVVKVLDFGLVKQVGTPGDTDQSQTTHGQIVGTPLYLSPEAITSPETLDGRADLYAIGAVGYLLLTGTPPFSGGSLVEVCGHHLHTAPEPPSARAPRPVPPDLESILLRCLAKSPADRPGSAKELREQLLACRAAQDFTQERAARWWTERGRKLVSAARKAAARPSDAPSVLLTRAIADPDSAPN
jgi:eukaryotic-like serine/threonine-protein kinase